MVAPSESGSPTRGSVCGVPRDREALYRGIAAELKTTAGKTEIPTYRVVVCGPLGAGKRTLVAKLRESLAYGERSSRSSHPRKHYGVDFTYVDVRRADGSLRYTVEYVTVDSPSVLAVAIQEATLSRTCVVFACDASEPRTSTDCVAEWAARVNERVRQLCPDDGGRALAAKREASCQEAASAVDESQLPPILLKRDDGHETQFDLRTSESICLLPCAVAVTKLDLVGDVLPSARIPMPPGADISAEGFLRDTIRTQAVRLGAASIMCPYARSVGGHADASSAFVVAVAEYLAQLAADSGKPPSVTKLAGALGTELLPLHFLPVGADTGKTIPNPIAAGAFSTSEAFPAAADSALAASSGPSASPAQHHFATHQEQLKGLFVAQQSAAPTASLGSSQSRAQSMSAAIPGATGGGGQPSTGATTPQPKGGEDDEVDLDFDDLS